jgi:hypothetical protein
LPWQYGHPLRNRYPGDGKGVARGRLATPLAAFVVVFAVAAGVSVVSGLLGRFVLVQRLGRTRRSARAAHAVTGLLLIVAGVDHLRQTRWVVAVYDWLIH